METFDGATNADIAKTYHFDVAFCPDKDIGSACGLDLLTEQARDLIANPLEASRGSVDTTSQAVARSERHGGASVAAKA